MWAVACPTTSLHSWTVPLYSSQITWEEYKLPLSVWSLFYVWVLQGASCPCTQDSWHRTLAVQDGPVLSLLESDPSLSMNILGSLSLPGVYPVGFFQADPWRGRSLLSWSPSWVSWSLQPGVPLTFTSPVSLSLFVGVRSSRAPVCTDSSISCVWKFPRNSLHCLEPAGLSLQQIIRLLPHGCYFCLPVKVPTPSFCRVRWPTADTNYSVTCTGLLLNPQPQVLKSSFSNIPFLV